MMKSAKSSQCHSIQKTLLVFCLAAVPLLLIIAFGRAMAAGSTLARFEQTQPVMGTLARIVVYAADEQAASRAMRAAFDRIETLNRILSDYDPESELNRLCRRAGGEAVAISPDLLGVLLQAQRLASRTEGAFDVTAAPLVQLWRRARRQRELPEPERVAKALELRGYRYLRVRKPAATAQLLKPGMRLDLGGIAKGFAADEALKMLSRSGIQKALVAIGGDIAVSGSPPGKQGWTVEIATDGFPQLQRPKPLLLCHAGVSTSGDAEQHVEIGGIRYSHIIDPRSGRALTGHSSVTVVARTAAESDSLATAVSVMGPEKGLKLVDSVKGAAVLIIEETVDGTRTFRSTRWKTD